MIWGGGGGERNGENIFSRRPERGVGICIRKFRDLRRYDLAEVV